MVKKEWRVLRPNKEETQMILTPIRWLILVGIAICGYFIITSNSTNIRAAAFVVSVVLWQFHGIIMVYDGYFLMKMNQKKKETTVSEEIKYAETNISSPVGCESPTT